MTRAEKFIPIILKNEGFGAYTNYPNDSGGETKFGIADAADGKKDGMTDTDFDGIPDKKIKDLALQDAIAIYKKKYFDPVKADLIQNELLALHVFDFAVNAGVKRSIKMLQRIVNTTQDGIIGKITLTLVNEYDYSSIFIAERKKYYKQIATGRNRVFLKGWLNRVENTTKAL